MNRTVTVKHYDAPKICEEEILRYMGVKKSSYDIDLLLKECINESISSFKYSVAYIETEVKSVNDLIIFDYFSTESTSLSKTLSGCDKAIIFSATVGFGIDRFISKYSRISPSKALCLQAFGAERIEALCELFSEEKKKEYTNTKARFSPGYGDLDIGIQRNICTILNSAKNIGLTLNDSMILSPSKSVTAIIGIERRN